MGLEMAGNIAALLGGAVKGYQDQSVLELKKRESEADVLHKKGLIDAAYTKEGFIKGPDGEWVLSPYAIEKQKLDEEYKRAQIDSTKALAEYRKEGGGIGQEIKGILGGLDRNPITGKLEAGPRLKAKDDLEQRYKEGLIKKALGEVAVPEAPSVVAKNKILTDAEKAKLIKQGYTIDPNNPENLIAPKVIYTPVEEEMIKEAIKQGRKYDPKTGKIEKLWDVKKDKPEKTIIEDTIEREVAKSVAVQATIYSQIMPVIKTFEDQNVSEKQKIAAGETIAKAINSNAGSWDAVTGGEAERALGQLDILPNKHKLKFRADTQEFLKSIKRLNKRIYDTINSNEQILKGVRSSGGVTGLLQKDNVPLPPDKKENEPPVMNNEKVIRAKSVLNDPKATEKAKLGARKYLNQLGVK